MPEYGMPAVRTMGRENKTCMRVARTQPKRHRDTEDINMQKENTKNQGCFNFYLSLCVTVSLCLCGLSILFFMTFHSPSVSAQEQKQQQPQQQVSIEEGRLSIIKSDIQKEVEHNEKLKKEIEEAQKTIDENTRERLLKVSKIYEAMPAEEAAKRLEKLDENTAVDIISMLKPRAAGGILAQMDSDKAASISKKIITKGKK